MAREKTLLERIATCQERSGGRVAASATEDLDALMGSVRKHLIRLLNARHGMSEALPDYGLPALNDLVVGDKNYAGSVEDSIRKAVEKYEPRLRRVRVARVAEDDSRLLSFRVDAILISQNGEHKVWYETEVTGAGDFNVTD